MSEQAEKNFVIQKIYLKDVSFESPVSPAVFSEENWAPEINVQLNTESNALAENVVESILKITVTAKFEDTTVFLVELDQAGVFTLEGFNDEEKAGMIGSYCPNLLFPYAREAISDLVGKGGFPQLLLAPVNFDALYARHLEQQQQAATEETAH
ncbi:MAG: protein-export chaperone SecB [Gammaproteobacteria bacterium]|nr:protein-export chaperone SecB [Gammaproteobacteria bacterium]